MRSDDVAVFHITLATVVATKFVSLKQIFGYQEKLLAQQ